MLKTTFREIKQSFGRYVAILAIVALGVGVFTGLKIVKPAMVQMADGYWQEMQLYDYWLLSTIGFEQEDVEAFLENPQVKAAEGSISTDILFLDQSENEGVMKVHSMTEDINGIQLLAGRLPKEAAECVVDGRLYTAENIGQKIRLSENNEQEDREWFAYEEYTIVGVAQSSYYANMERGNTALGNGKVSGFMYIPKAGFDREYYTEVFVKLDHDLPIYSDDYEAYMEEREEIWDAICKQQVEERFASIVEEAQAEIDDAAKELHEEKSEAETELSDALQELTDAEAEIADGWAELEDAMEEVEENERELTDQEKLLKDKENEFENQMAMLTQSGLSREQALAMMPQLQMAEEQLTAARTQIDSGKKQIRDAKEDIEDAKTELEDAEAEWADGFAEYEEAKAEFDAEIADAQEKLADAQAELDDLEEPDYYVFDRNSNVGYACFENDASIIDGIANVIPVFFFLVAALVCMTTMNRMIEEHRTQIGVLKALGYGERAIMSKYLFYSGSAAILGGVVGFFGGTYFFPKIIWIAYSNMYSLRDVAYVSDLLLAAVSMAVALLCSMGATWFTCKNELAETAANLMRPKAPKAGKRVFLEYIPFIWKRMKFLHKVSVRNIFRYKKRFFMMVAGISGCTALLVTGFGIRDSVAEVADHQFDQIQVYDMSVMFADAQTKGETDFTKMAETEAEGYAYVCEMSVDVEFEGNVKSVNLVVADGEELEQFVNLHTPKGQAVALPGDGEAVISHKIAQNYGIEVGDTIVLRDEDMRQIEATVSDVFVNYLYSYVYINGETYKAALGEAAEFKTAYVNLEKDRDPHQISAEFMQLEEVSAVTVNADTRERINSMLTSLDYVVALIIFCAAFLAFVVLYNLTNINITERIREIATLKVLGFYRNESASYVFRENLILTVIGTGVGLLLGKVFHAFVMSQVNVDMVSFQVRIAGVSYLYSVILTIAFACIVNLFMSAKLEAVNMAESLKSVD